jgi:hypothetical protein
MREYMDSKRQIELSYTEDFVIACTINNLNYTELLQYFIDHVSFYGFIGGDVAAAYLWATTVCIESREDIGREVKVVTDKTVKQISLKYIQMLTALIRQTDHLATETKSRELMKAWSGEMLFLTNYLGNVELAGTAKLSLSFDFNLLCSMSGITIQEQLQYFIDHISLARQRASSLLHGTNNDPSTALLLSWVSSDKKVKGKLLPQQHIYRKYGLQLLKLDITQREESDLATRILNYRAFYQDWYHALNRGK